MTESYLDYKSTLKCPQPFNSVYYSMNGEMGPCNLNPIMKVIPIKDYLKSPELLRIKNDMLNEVRTSGHCSERCYKYEDMNVTAQRQWMLQLLPDQTVYETHKTQYMEVRFNNLCNCKCRICNSITSSAIASEEKTYGLFKGPILNYSGQTDDFILNEVKQQIDDLKIVSFSGGEPLLQWQHWEFLDHLIENNKKPDLYYYTNGSTISYKGTHITEKWKHFNKILYRVSIDVSGSAVDYWRPGTGADWNTIVNNIRSVREKTDNVEIWYIITLAWPTLFRIGELLEDLEKIDIGEFEIGFNTQWEPRFDIQHLPPEYKKKAIDYLRNLVFLHKSQKIKWKLNQLINYFDDEDNSHIMVDAIKYLKEVDIRRNQSFIEVFPEYKELAEKYGY